MQKYPNYLSHIPWGANRNNEDKRDDIVATVSDVYVEII